MPLTGAAAVRREIVSHLVWVVQQAQLVVQFEEGSVGKVATHQRACHPSYSFEDQRHLHKVCGRKERRCHQNDQRVLPNGPIEPA